MGCLRRRTCSRRAMRIPTASRSRCLGHWVGRRPLDAQWHRAPPNQDNFVQASQLAQVAYNVGVGTDTLWVRASDGIQYGPWSNAFTLAGTVLVETSDGSALSTIVVGAGETVEVGSAFFRQRNIRG